MQRERDRDFHAMTGGLAYDEIPVEQRNAAAIRLTSLCIGHGVAKMDLVELLEMVGCIDAQIAAAATAAVAGDLTPLGYTAPLTAQPEPRKRPPRWVWCRKGLHRMVGVNRWVSPTTGKGRCRPCGNEFDRQAKLRKKAHDCDQHIVDPGSERGHPHRVGCEQPGGGGGG